MSAALRARGWHSILEVQPERELRDWPRDAAGAFVHVLALAFSEDHFKELAYGRLHQDGFTVVGCDLVRPFDPDINDWHEVEAAALHDSLNLSEPVSYSTFDTYPKDGLHA